MMLIIHNTTWKRIATMNELDVHNTNNELQPRLNYALAQQISSKCNNCQKKLHIHTQFAKIPMIMALDGAELNGTINIDHTIILPLDGGGNETMVLRGIIYHGGYYFTSRATDSEQNIGYHDGQTTGSKCLHEGTLKNTPPNMLRTAGEMKASILIYGSKA
jgi:hypothetical protein